MTLVIVCAVISLIVILILFSVSVFLTIHNPNFIDINAQTCIVAVKVIKNSEQFPIVKQDTKRETNLSQMIDKLMELVAISNETRTTFLQAKTRADKHRLRKQIKVLTSEMLNLSEKITNTVPV